MTTTCPAIRGRIDSPEVVGVLRRVGPRPTVITHNGVPVTHDGAWVYVASAPGSGYLPELRGRIHAPTITGRWC